MDKLIKRNQQNSAETWNVGDLYTSDEAWLAAYTEVSGSLNKIADCAGKISVSAAELYRFIELSEEITEDVRRIYCYAMLKSDEDKGDSKYADFFGRAVALYTEYGAKSAFSGPEIISIPDQTLEKFYIDEPRLIEFKRLFAVIRAAKDHTLTPSEEMLLAAAGEVASAPENIASQFRNADLRFPDITSADGQTLQVTQGSFIPLMESPDINIRRQAFESVYHTYEKYKNSVAAMLDAQIKQLTFFRKARKFGSNLEKSVFGNEVPVTVYENLVKSVNDQMSVMHKYVALRKKLLGVNELHMYDLYTPIVPDVDPKYPFELSKELCRKALEPLGEKYLTALDEGFANRWIDVYENEGKRGGAYSMGARPHPYVLLNHKDTLDSMFTLAHEMGHALHSYFSSKTQRPAYSEYVIFVAEVASIFNESLLMQYLLKTTTDKKQKCYLINHFLEQFRTTLYRQTMFAEFELEINKIAESGQTLTADALCDAYYKLNRKYYGEDITVDREIAMEWARIPHFFYDFYVYQYSTGFAAAVALSEKVLREGQPAVDAYLNFLSGGNTADPITLLRGAGVDMTSSAPVDDALALFDKLIDELDSLLG
jgi:oligoendopeptidase F